MKLGLLLFTIAFAVALLVGAGSARAQSSPPPSGGSDAAPTQNPAAAAAEPPAPSDKKVWTNEDMKDLRTQPDLSTFEKSCRATCDDTDSADGRKPVGASVAAYAPTTEELYRAAAATSFSIGAPIRLPHSVHDPS
jgi:hypothetical protein